MQMHTSPTMQTRDRGRVSENNVRSSIVRDLGTIRESDRGHVTTHSTCRQQNVNKGGKTKRACWAYSSFCSSVSARRLLSCLSTSDQCPFPTSRRVAGLTNFLSTGRSEIPLFVAGPSTSPSTPRPQGGSRRCTSRPALR
jgi:hypothetical protein